MGANSFRLEQAPFHKGLVCRYANRKSKKLSPLYKMAQTGGKLRTVNISPFHIDCAGTLTDLGLHFLFSV